MSRNALRRKRMSRKELVAGVLFFLLLVLMVLYGMYLGMWLLRKEEEHSRASSASDLRQEILRIARRGINIKAACGGESSFRPC